MEVVVKVVIAPCRATVPTLNTSAIHRCCSHRTTADWTHISSLHHHGSRATSGGSGNARSSKTTAAPKTTATTESSTTSETSATSRVTTTATAEATATSAMTTTASTTAVSCHCGGAYAQCHS